MDFSKQTAMELGEGIETGRIDPVELTEFYLDRIDAHEEGGRIYARVTRERAMHEASAAADRAKRGVRFSPLDGIPVSWKDLFDTAGVLTEAGSKILKGRIPQKDCTVVQRATNAGTVLLGKTHMSELAFSGLGINPVSATPPNIFNSAWVPGGSSSGAGASVSFDLAPIAIGSDTGGSVRIPACWQSLVGLKTTSGLLPNDGVVPLCSGFDTIGPLAKSVADAAAMFDILGDSIVEREEISVPSIKLGVLCGGPICVVDEKPQSAFAEALQRLAANGVSIEDIEPSGLQEIHDLGPTLFPFEAWNEWGREIEKHPDAVFEPVKQRFLQGRTITREQYDTAWQRMEALRLTILDQLSAYDAVVLPTIPILPPSVKSLMEDVPAFGAANLNALRNTRIVNLLGACALTLPTHEDACGFMVMSRPLEEGKLLAIGAAIERMVRG